MDDQRRCAHVRSRSRPCGSDATQTPSTGSRPRRSLYPIFVAEGESPQKYRRIRHSDFLHKAYRSFQEIGGTLFIYGHAMSPNDEHIIRLIGRGKLDQLLVGIYGDENSEANRAIRARVTLLQNSRSARKPARPRPEPALGHWL